MTIGVKRCPKCGKEKPLDEFYVRKNHGDGFSSYCKECVKKTKRQSVSSKRDEIDALKTPCLKCGEERKYLLDFHHVNPSEKEFAVSETGRYSSLTNVKAEIEKCVCLCKNCHWEFHHLYGKHPKNPIVALKEYLNK